MPLMQDMHCMTHRSNLAVQCLSDLEMVVRIEIIIAALYKYFNKSSKRHLKLQKLAELLESKGKKNSSKYKNDVDFNVESIETCFVGVTHPFGKDILWSFCKTNNPDSQCKL